MKSLPTNCIYCNSLQRFAPKKRVAWGKIETYIVCHACKRERIIDIKTTEEVRAQSKRIRRRNQRMRRA